MVNRRMNITWVGLTLISMVCGAILAFLIRGYLFMDKVETNHLAHIQADMHQTVLNTAATNQAILELAIREEERHKQEQQTFEELKTLIRTLGL